MSSVGSTTQPAKPQPVTWMNVKSLVTWPQAGQVLPARPVDVCGIAWTGRGHVTKVEVSIDGHGWVEATLLGEPEVGSWRQWRLNWDSTSQGRHLVAARANDSMGEIKPQTPA